MIILVAQPIEGTALFFAPTEIMQMPVTEAGVAGTEVWPVAAIANGKIHIMAKSRFAMVKKMSESRNVLPGLLIFSIRVGKKEPGSLK